MKKFLALAVLALVGGAFAFRAALAQAESPQPAAAPTAAHCNSCGGANCSQDGCPMHNGGACTGSCGCGK